MEKEYAGELQTVTLPHTVVETPFHYFDESIYQMVSGYRKTFVPEESWREKQVLFTIEAAGHQAEVYLNGNKITECIPEMRRCRQTDMLQSISQRDPIAHRG